MAIKSKTIQIVDNGHTHTFEINTLSGLAMSRWLVRAILTLDGVEFSNQMAGSDTIGAVVGYIQKNFLRILLSADPDKLLDMVEGLVAKSMHVNGKVKANLTEHVLEQIDLDFDNYMTLVKEVLGFNLGFLSSETSSQTSQEVTDSKEPVAFRGKQSKAQ